MSVKLTTLDKVHKEVNSEIVLEDVIHTDDERMLYSIKNVLLKLKTIEEILIDNYIFADAFHCIDSS